MSRDVDPADAYVVHADPVWRDRANFIFNAALPVSDSPKRFEQLFGRQVAETEFELCCIPFFLYDVSLGDIIGTDRDFLMNRVVRASGRYTFRVWFGGHAGPKEQIAGELQQLGALLEWRSRNLLAVDAADVELAQPIADYLQAQENHTRLTFETGRT